VSDNLRQLLVHPAAWRGLVDYYDARGIDIVRVPVEGNEDFPTYILSPRALSPKGEPHPGGEMARRSAEW
jgi:hypothetical protein